MKSGNPISRTSTLLVFLVLLLTPQVVAAGPILDWLFPRRAARRAARAQAITANYGAGSCQTNCPTIWTQTTQRQIALRYIPQTAYRTVWASVPVTQYRPTTTTNPLTGCTTTCMRPCTSYTWQARRVPYTTYRPVYTSNTTTSPWAVAYGGGTAMGAAPMGLAATQAAGGYLNGSAFSPNTVIPNVAGGTPTGFGWGMNSPSLPYVQGGTAAGTSQSPDCVGCGQSGSTYVAPGSNPAPQTTSPFPPPYNPSGSDTRTPSGSGTRAPADTPPALFGPDVDPARRGVPTDGEESTSEGGSSTQSSILEPNGTRSSSLGSMESNRFSKPSNVRPSNGFSPILDPRRNRARTPKSDNVPQLLNPRDRTARRGVQRRTYAAVPIAWPKTSRPARVQPLQQESAERTWDDSGWSASSR